MHLTLLTLNISDTLKEMLHDNHEENTWYWWMDLNVLCCACCCRFWTSLWQALFAVYQTRTLWYVKTVSVADLYEATSSFSVIFGQRQVFLGPTAAWNPPKSSLCTPHQRQTQDESSPATSRPIRLYFFGMCSGGAVCLAAVPCLCDGLRNVGHKH